MKDVIYFKNLLKDLKKANGKLHTAAEALYGKSLTHLYLRMTRPDQGLSSFAPGGGKMRDPGNEVELEVTFS